jgi:hypothetical protein
LFISHWKVRVKTSGKEWYKNSAVEVVVATAAAAAANNNNNNERRYYTQFVTLSERTGEIIPSTLLTSYFNRML